MFQSVSSDLVPRLRAITVERYRSFLSPTRFELKPFTLLYGQNNSGKSALLRLLPLLSASVAENASGPLELNTDAAAGAGFRDLTWNGERVCHIKLEWSGLSARYTFRFKLMTEPSPVEIEVLELTVGNKASLVFVAEGERYLVGPHRELALTPVIGWTFQGLRPIRAEGASSDSSEHSAALTALARHLQTLRGPMQYLNARRASIKQEIRARGISPIQLKANGEDAGDVLVNSPEILADTARWYRKDRIRRELISSPLYAPVYQLLLNPIDNPALRIPLRESGEGMQHVLPILVAVALAERQGAMSWCVVEEPESHLHDVAQRALAEELCRVAAIPDGPCIVAETHSRLLLLGVQWAVSQGVIPPENVQIYWLHQTDGKSQCHPVSVQRDGALKGWPPGVFLEEQRLGRELLQWQLEQESPDQIR